MRRLLAMPSLVALSLLVAASPAGAITYQIDMDPGQEVPGPGEAGGDATGTITMDFNGEIAWDITYTGLTTPLSAMHIHAGSAGEVNPPLIDLGISTSGGAGTLISSILADAATVAGIIANPTAFYINIHNTPFPGGAVRDQLGTIPEPGTLALLGAALAALGLRQRAQR
jgi:CHRD domain/PEP-CTERM motif